jgi:hypothetical protein
MTIQIEHLRRAIHIESRIESRKFITQLAVSITVAAASVLGAGIVVSQLFKFHVSTLVF